MRSMVLTQECLLRFSIARMRWYHISVWYYLSRKAKPLFHQAQHWHRGRLWFPPACLWAQSKTTVKIRHLSEIRHWKQCLPMSQISLPFCQYVCLTLDQNMHSLENWYPITLLTAPMTHQRWSLISKLPLCQKTWRLIFWDRRVLQGLDCKISWSKVCSYKG